MSRPSAGGNSIRKRSRGRWLQIETSLSSTRALLSENEILFRANRRLFAPKGHKAGYPVGTWLSNPGNFLREGACAMNHETQIEHLSDEELRVELQSESI
jgi:hypothetical protein